jgi:hypothetical protein
VFTYVVLPVTVKLPVMRTSPVTIPPLFASNELLARTNAALAWTNAEATLLFCVVFIPSIALADANAALA